MAQTYSQALTVGSLILGLLSGNLSLAFAPESDLLKTKGYSPLLIETTEVQRSRQEWRDPPAPTLTPREQFLHNIYYNDWTGSVDPFGSKIIREHQ